jgi:hypothetical protein
MRITASGGSSRGEWAEVKAPLTGANRTGRYYAGSLSLPRVASLIAEFGGVSNMFFRLLRPKTWAAQSPDRDHRSKISEQ